MEMAVWVGVICTFSALLLIAGPRRHDTFFNGN